MARNMMHETDDTGASALRKRSESLVSHTRVGTKALLAHSQAAARAKRELPAGDYAVAQAATPPAGAGALRTQPARRPLMVLIMALVCALAALAVSAAAAVAAPEQAFAADVAYACYCTDGTLVFDVVDVTTSTAPSEGEYTFSNGETHVVQTVWNSTVNNQKFLTTKYDPTKTKNATYPPWYSVRTNIKSVEFAGAIAPTYMDFWFYGCAITELPRNWYGALSTSNLKSCDYMFAGCTSLTDVTMASWTWDPLSNVTAISATYMFSGCINLGNVELSGWEANKLTNASRLFNGCTALYKVSMATWKAPALTNLSYAFAGCTSLKEVGKMFGDDGVMLAPKDVDLATWEAPTTLTDISHLFDGCTGLGAGSYEVDLSGWSCPAATSIAGMFQGCKALTKAKLSGTQFAAATNADSMFLNCQALTDLDLTGADFSAVDSAKSFLGNCVALSSVDLSTCGLGAKLTAAESASAFFTNCTSLEQIKVGPDWPSAAVSAGANFPRGTQDGESADFLWSCVEAPAYVSHGYKSDPAVAVPSPADAGLDDGASATYVAGVAAGLPLAVFCAESSTLYFYQKTAAGKPTTHNDHEVTGVYGGYETFDAADTDKAGATAAEKIWWYDNRADVKSVKFECDVRPTSTAYWFYGMEQLDSVVGIGRLDVSGITSADYWFYGCQVLDFDASGVAAHLATGASAYPNLLTAQYLCAKCSTLSDTALAHMLKFVSGELSPSLTDVSYAFSECTALTTADLSGKALPEVLNATGAFLGDTALLSVNLSEVSAPKLTNVTSMFQGCTSLSSFGSEGCAVNTKELSASLIATTTSLFSGCSALESVDLSHLDTSAMATSTNMLQDCDRLETIKVNSTFGSNTAPQATYPVGYKDGSTCAYLWYCEETSRAVSSAEATKILTFTQSGSEGSVATYRAGAQAGTLAAAYIADGNELVFYRMGAGDSATTHDGRTVTKLYDGGFEYATYNYTSTKAPWYTYRASIKKVSFEDKLTPQSMAWWFADFTALESFPEAGALDLSENVSFEGTFKGCTKLAEVGGMADWSSPLATTAHAMFAKCTSLVKADLSGWQAPNVARIHEMFARCTSLTTCLGQGTKIADGCATAVTRSIGRRDQDLLYIWDGVKRTGKGTAASVNYLLPMFGNCKSLKYMGNYAYVTSMGGGLDLTWLTGCSSWRSLAGRCVNEKDTYGSVLDTEASPVVGIDLSGLDCPNLTTAQDMLYGATSLSYANLSGWGAPNLTTGTTMFDKASPLTAMGSASFVAGRGGGSGIVVDEYKLAGHYTAFQGLTKLQAVDLSDCTMNSLPSMQNMFINCTALESVSLNNWCPSAVTTVATMLNGCTALSYLNISGFSPPNLTTATDMIAKSAPLIVMGSAEFVADTGGSGIVVDDYAFANHGNMFGELTKLKQIDLTGCQAPSLSTAQLMFRGCTALSSVKLGNWQCPAASSACGMFGRCTSLVTADIRGWYAPNCANVVEMFANCPALTTCLSEGATLADRITASEYRLFGCTSDNLDDVYRIWPLSPRNTRVKGTSGVFGIFNGCPSLRYAGNSEFVSSRGQGADLSAFQSATSWRNMFALIYDRGVYNSAYKRYDNELNTGAANLVSVDLSNLSCPNLTSVQAMFYSAQTLESANLTMEAPSLTNTSQMFEGCTSLGEIAVGQTWPHLSSNYQTLPAGMQEGAATRYLWYCDETRKYVNALDVSTKQIPTVAETNPEGTVATYRAGVRPDSLVGIYTQANTTLSLFRTSVFPPTTYGGVAVTEFYIAPEETSCAADADVPWNAYRSAITTVSIQDDADIPIGAGVDGGRSPVTYWFDNMAALTSLQGLSGIDVSAAGNLSGAFAGCSKLTELNLEGWDTAAVSDMSGLLSGCSALERVQVGSGWSQESVSEGKEATFPGEVGDGWYEVLTYKCIGVIDEDSSVAIPTNTSGHSLVYINDEPCFYAVFCAGDSSLTFVGGTVKAMPSVGEAYEAAGGKAVSALYTIWQKGELVTDAYKQWSALRHEVKLVRVPYLVSAPSSATHWFEGFTELTEVEGLSNLVTADTTDFAYLFNGCSSLETLDFSGQDTRKADDMTAMLSGCDKLESFSMGEGFAQKDIAEGREARFPVVAGEKWVGADGAEYAGGDVVPDGAGSYARKLSRQTISVTAPAAGIDFGVEKDGTLEVVTGEAIRNNGSSRVSVTGWKQSDAEGFVGVTKEQFPVEGDEPVSWYAKVRTQLAPAAYEARHISDDAEGIYPGGAASDEKDGTWTMAAAGAAGSTDRLLLSADDGVVELAPKWWTGKEGGTGSELELAGTVTWQLAASDATVTFVANGGPDVPSQQVALGGHADAPEYVPDGGAAPVAYEEGETKAYMEGLERTFAGWYTDRDFSEESKWDFGERVTGNTVLYAKWTGDPIVRFELEGGTWTDDDVTNPQGVAVGGKVTRPSNPSKVGGVLDYWYTWESTGGMRTWDFENDTVTGDMVLHAHYKNHATVTFNPNGGKLDGSTLTKDVVFDLAEDKLPSCTLDRMDVEAPSADYVFDGWALKADAGADDVHYRTGDDVPLTDDVELYAVWGTVDAGSAVTIDTADGSSWALVQHVVSEKLNGEAAERGIVYLGSDGAVEASDADLVLVQNNMAEAYSEGMAEAYGKARQGGVLSEDLELSLSRSGAEAPLMKSAAAVRGYLVYADGNGDEWISYSDLVTTGTTAGTSASTSTFSWRRAHAVTFDTAPGNVGTAPSTLAPQRVAEGYPVYAPGALARTGAAFDAWCSDEGLSAEWAVAGTTRDSRAEADRVTGDLTLHARWLCTVTFDSNEGSDVDGVVAVADRVMSAPDQPTLSGCNFAGWFSDDGTFKNAWDFSSAKVESDMELHAKWTCTVQFNANHGSNGPAAQTVARYAKASVPTRIPTRTGYDFTGWYESSDGGATLSEDAWDFSREITEGVTLYAGWERSVYTVTFDTAGGSSVDAQRVEHGGKAQRPSPDPELEGCTLTDWYSNQARTKVFNFDSAITRDTVVYAGWSAQYYVRFWSTATDDEDSEYELYAQVPVTAGSIVARPDDPDTAERTGYHVVDWHLAATPDEGEDEGEDQPLVLGDAWDFDNNVVVADNIDKDGYLDLYAEWAINVYNFEVDTVGGWPAKYTLHVEHGSKVVKPDDPRKAEATFQGWYSDPSYVVEHDFDVPVTSDMSIYAKWDEKMCTVSFEPNGGDEIAPQVLKYGVRATQPDAKRAGYKNPVWYTDKGLSQAYDFRTNVTGDITLYADWTPVGYKVGFDANFPEGTEAAAGNKAMAAAAATYDAETVLPANTYACKGYVFDGWNTEPDGSGEAFADGASVENLSETDGEVVTLYAQWATGYADYTVRHMQQDASGDGYTEVASDRQAFTAKVGETTAAVANSYTGFTARAVEQKQVGPRGDTVVDVLYDRNTFKVTFDENGHGTAPAAYTGVRYDAKIAAPAEPTADGVEFVGWYRDPGGVSAWDFDADTVTGPVTLYAKWAQAPYVIRFEPNYPDDTEADFDNVVMDPIRADIGRSYRLTFNTLRAKGYTFTGWNTAADGSGTAYEDHELVKDLSETPGATVPLYAQWEAGPTTYTVEHYQQDAEGDGYALAESEVLEGATHGTTEAVARSYEGFKAASSFDQATIGPKRDTVVKIYYDRLTYDVTFDANGHGTAPAALNGVRYGATAAWPSVDPEADDLAFVGWYTDAACTEAYDFSLPVTSSFTLYAKWTSDYVTVKYAANNAVDTTAAEVRVPKDGGAKARTYASFHESTATSWARYRPARTAADGSGAVAYQSVFLGWKGSDGKNYAPGDVLPAGEELESMAEGLTLTARWGELLAESVSADMYASGDELTEGISLADGEAAVALFQADLKASPNMDETMVTFKGYGRGYDGAKAAMATSSTSKALGECRVSGADGEERSYEVEQRLGASSTADAVSFSPALQVRDADGAEWGLYLRGNSFSYDSLAENAGGAHSWTGSGFVASRDAGGVKDAALKRYETAEWAFKASESYDATADGGPATHAKGDGGTWEWESGSSELLSTHSVSASAALPGDGATKLVTDGEGGAADALSTASSDASGGSDGDTSAGSASAGTEMPGSGASDSAATAGDDGDGAASAGAGGDDPASDAARQSAISVTGPLD